MIYSATPNQEGLTDDRVRQITFTGFGLVALLPWPRSWTIANWPWSPFPAFLLLLIALVLVYFLGDTQGSARKSWINVGGTLIQPTEAGKFLLIIFLRGI